VKVIFICTLPRTGSSLLSADMRSTVALGEPREYFNINRMARLREKWSLPVDDLDAYIAALKKRTVSPNGVVGVKLMVAQLRRLKGEGHFGDHPAPLRALVERFGSDVMIVKLLRRDKLRQAISLVKARQTGKWGVLRDGEGEPTYESEDIDRAILDLAIWEALWQREIEASGFDLDLDLAYEDIVVRRDETLLDIARWVGLDDPEGVVGDRDREDVKLQRQSNDVTEEWIDRYIGYRGAPASARDPDM
jgi:LPS sulfotransferase NodH